MKLEEVIVGLLKKPLEDFGYTLVSAKFQKEGPEFYLHVIVDRDAPIDLDAIVSVSDLISPILDSSDPIPNNYVLDVSSLGAEKPLEVNKLIKYVGSHINIHLSSPYKGENILEGDLVDANDSEITLAYRIKTKSVKAVIKLSDVDKARLAVKF
jgi:ribosome maturation factor RimP